jgi:hypothetical protein
MNELEIYIADLNYILKQDYKNEKSQTFYDLSTRKRIEIYQSIDGKCFVKYIIQAT